MKHAVGARVTFEPAQPRTRWPLSQPVTVAAHGPGYYVVRTKAGRAFTACEDELSAAATYEQPHEAREEA